MAQTRGFEIEGQIDQSYTYENMADIFLKHLNKEAMILFKAPIVEVGRQIVPSKNGADSLKITYKLMSRTYHLVLMNDITIEVDEANLKGLEIVSPILKDGSDTMLFAVAVQEFARETGFRPQKQTTGFHVHIDANKFNLEKIRSLLRFFAEYEDALYRNFQVEEKRLSYTKKVGELIEKLDKNSDLRLESSNPKNDLRLNIGERYYGLNVLSFFKLGTVEFRLFNSTINAAEIAHIVEFCRRFVKWNEEGRPFYKSALKTQPGSVEELSDYLKMSIPKPHSNGLLTAPTCSRIFRKNM